MGNHTREELNDELAQLCKELTPDQWDEFKAYVAHLVEAQEAGEPPLEPAEFSKVYRERLELFSKEGEFFLMAARFTPFYQRVTWCCIVKAAREHPETSPGDLLPIVAAEMDAMNHLMQEPPAAGEDTAETVKGGLAA